MKKVFAYIVPFSLVFCLHKNALSGGCKTTNNCGVVLRYLGDLDENGTSKIYFSLFNKTLGGDAKTLNHPGSGTSRYTFDNIEMNVSGGGCGTRGYSLEVAYNECPFGSTLPVAECAVAKTRIELKVNAVLTGSCRPADGWGFGTNFPTVDWITNTNNTACWEIKRGTEGPNGGFGYDDYFSVKFLKTKPECQAILNRAASIMAAKESKNNQNPALQIITDRKPLRSANGEFRTKFYQNGNKSYFAVVNDHDNSIVWKTDEMTNNAVAPDKLLLVSNGFAYFGSSHCKNGGSFGSVSLPSSGSDLKLSLTNDGVLNVIGANQDVLWSSSKDSFSYDMNPKCDRNLSEFSPGERMVFGDSLTSSNKNYSAKFEKSKLCTYKKGNKTPLWCSKTFEATAKNGEKIHANVFLNNGNEFLFVATDACLNKEAVLGRLRIPNTTHDSLFVNSQNGELDVGSDRMASMSVDKFGEFMKISPDCSPLLQTLRAGKTLKSGEELFSPDKNFQLSVADGALCVQKMDTQEKYCTQSYSSNGVFADTFVFGGNKGSTYFTNSKCPDVKFAVPNSELFPSTSEGTQYSANSALQKASTMQLSNNGTLSVTDSKGENLGINLTDLAGISNIELFVINPEAYCQGASKASNVSKKLP